MGERGLRALLQVGVRLRELGTRRAWQRNRGFLVQTAKMAVAAALAFELAKHAFGTPVPALASMAAVITVQVTVSQTVRRATEYVVGVIAGVIAAIFITTVVGVHGWTIALMIFVATLVGRFMRLGPQVNQVGISALLVMTLGVQYGSVRAVDTVIGAVVGVLVNALVAPPTHVRSAGTELAQLADQEAGVFGQMSRGVTGEWGVEQARQWLREARALTSAVTSAQTALERADDSIKLNARARQSAEGVARLEEASTALEHVSSQTRSVARDLLTVAEQSERDGDRAAVPGPIAVALQRINQALLAYGDVLDPSTTDPAAARARLTEAVSDARAAAVQASASVAEDGGRHPQLFSSLVVMADRLVGELDPEGSHGAAVPS